MKRLFDEAKRYIPGGVNSPVRSWKAVGGEPRPDVGAVEPDMTGERPHVAHD